MTVADPAPRCHFCGAAVTDDSFCFGCRVHVCEACENPDNDARPTGRHLPSKHLAWRQTTCLLRALDTLWHKQLTWPEALFGRLLEAQIRLNQAACEHPPSARASRDLLRNQRMVYTRWCRACRKILP